MDVKKLVPKIRAVLTAPGVDLSQISAKGVRKQLQSEDPSLDPEWIKEHKTEIDALILEVFDAVNSGKGYSNGEADDGEDDADTPGGSGSSEADGSKGVKRKRSESPTIPPSSVLPPSQLPMAKVSKAAAHSITDAKLARQISAELNSRPTRGSSSQVNRKKLVNGRSGSSKKSKVKKSPSKIVDSDGDEDEEDEDDEAHSSKKVKKRGGGGFQKEFILSDSLASLTGVTSLSRPQVVKHLWDHIKANSLQDPNDKREIICDDAMKNVFGVTRLNMFTMNKMIGNHLFEPEEVASS